MDICYNKFFKLFIDKNLKETEFTKKRGNKSKYTSKTL